MAGVSPAWIPQLQPKRLPLQENASLPSKTPVSVITQLLHCFAPREFLLLAGLLAFTFARENLFPIPHFASGTNDPERARDSGDESSKLL